MIYPSQYAVKGYFRQFIIKLLNTIIKVSGGAINGKQRDCFGLFRQHCNEIRKERQGKRVGPRLCVLPAQGEIVNAKKSGTADAAPFYRLD